MQLKLLHSLDKVMTIGKFSIRKLGHKTGMSCPIEGGMIMNTNATSNPADPFGRLRAGPGRRRGAAMWPVMGLILATTGHSHPACLQPHLFGGRNLSVVRRDEQLGTPLQGAGDVQGVQRAHRAGFQNDDARPNHWRR